MILDAVTFHSIEMEIAHGIAHGGATMGETMHTMTAAIMSMPVVKKIIVQQSALHQGGLIHRKLPFFHEKKTDVCHMDAVPVDGCRAMLHGLLFFVESSLHCQFPDGVGQKSLESGR